MTRMVCFVEMGARMVQTTCSPSRRCRGGVGGSECE